MDKVRLSIDIGNTRVKASLFKGNEELEFIQDVKLPELKKLIGKNPSSLTVSKTGTNSEIEDFLQSQSEVRYVNYKTPIPIELDYSSPETLGSDRIAGAVGAHTLYPGKNILILDMGTCITLDLLDNKAVFRGGIISPGIDMRFRAMHEFTAALPLVKLDENVTFPGKNSMESMQVGVYQSVRNELKGYFDLLAGQLDQLIVVDCSSNRIHFDKARNYKIFAQPKLVLFGLNVIARYNA